MSLPEIRDEWHIPARLGQRVLVRTPFTEPAPGTITGSLDDWIRIQCDSGRKALAYPHELTFPKG